MRRRCRLALVSLGFGVGLGVGFACGPHGASSEVASHAGASLIEQQNALRLGARAAGAQLDVATAGRLEELAARAPFVLDAAAWVEVERLSPEASSVALTGVAGASQRTAGRWEQPAPFDLDLPLGRVGLELHGEPLRAHRPKDTPDGYAQIWRDTSVPIAVAWQPAASKLVAISEHRPPQLQLGLHAGTGPQPGLWARGDSGRAAPVSRVTLGDDTRRVLPVSTPGVLSVELDSLESAQLDVGIALAELGVEWRDGTLRAARDPAPRVRFAVDIVQGDTRERAWSQTLTPAASFLEARVDLSAWKGRACRLELVTESDAPPSHCFAMWSGLRFRDAQHAAPTRPHIVLIDLDTLRADGLGSYGNPRDSSPRLDAWAAREAVRFSDHVAVNNWTLPSTVSMLTGLPVSAHGVLRFPLAMNEEHQPLAQRLAEVGYETRAHTDGGFVVPEHGFAIGFERFLVKAPTHVQFAQDGWDDELTWLRERDSAAPVFLFLQTYKVHAPFLNDARFDDPADPYTGPLAAEPVRVPQVEAAIRAAGGTLSARDERYLRDIYDAGVRRVDTVLGEFLEALPEVFGHEPYVVVVTSDHGEELGERGTIGHGTTLHREQLAVPLFIRPPDGAGARVIDAPVSGLDLVPSLLELAGLPRDESLPGLALLSDHLPAERARVSRHDEHGAAIDRLGWKLIHDSAPDDEHTSARRLGTGLYDTRVDPGERESLATQQHERAEQLRAALEQDAELHRLRTAPRASLSAGASEQLDQLRELGYLEGG